MGIEGMTDNLPGDTAIDTSSDDAFLLDLFAGETPPPLDEVAPTGTPEVKEADLPPAKPDDAPVTDTDDADVEHVQLSKADYMRLMNLEAQQKLAQMNAAPAAPEGETAPAQAAQAAAPVARPEWTPEVTPIPISLSQDWVDAFAFESQAKGNEYIGALINTPIQKAAEYTQNAVAAVEARVQQQIHAITQNFGLFQAVNQVLKDRPEYRGENMAQVELAAKESLMADPTLTAWDLPEAITKRLDASAAKAKQIMKSGGKINAVPQGGLKGASTGARTPADTGRAEAPTDPELQFLKDLGYPG